MFLTITLLQRSAALALWWKYLRRMRNPCLEQFYRSWQQRNTPSPRKSAHLANETKQTCHKLHGKLSSMIWIAVKIFLHCYFCLRIWFLPLRSFTIWMMLTILDTEHHGILRTLSNRHTKQFFSQSFMRNHNLLHFRICSFLAVIAKFSLSIKEYNSIEVSGGISVLYIP